jgi:integrase
LVLLGRVDSGPHRVHLEAWSPRELRHSFVSLLSNGGVSIEDIADVVGHSGTSVTEKVYRHQLRPVLLEPVQQGRDALLQPVRQRRRRPLAPSHDR